MKCLVLGGSGFIGSHLCDALVASNYEVVIYDRPGANMDNLKGIRDRISYLPGDFSQQGNFDEVLQDVNFVFHLISTTVPKTSNQDMSADIQGNLIPTLALLDSCVRKSVRKIIFFSSGGTVYGNPQDVPICETHPTHPTCSYGVQKLAIEKYLQVYNHLFNLDYAVMRVANPYGPRQTPFGSQGVVAAFLARILLRQPIEVWGDGSVVRDFLYISDVIDAALMLTTYRGDTKTFNIGSGKGYSIKEIIAEMQEKVDSPVEISYLPSEKRDVAINVLDISKAANELGWSPRIKLCEGINEMMQCWSADKKSFCL